MPSAPGMHVAASIRSGAAERLATLLRIPTVSRSDADDTDWQQFALLRAALEETYPDAFRVLEVELIAEHTILGRWTGRSPGDATLMMAHQDVVAATDDGWTHPPFAGVIVDGVLWGRGANDDKGSLAGILEAIDALAAAGHVPEHDVWMLAGHDEETHGTGASAAVARLVELGVTPSLVLDEGGAVVEPPIAGVHRDAAMIGVSEKGTCTVRLRVQQIGGHASTPPRRPATARLARAILRLSRMRFPRSLSPVAVRMLQTLGSEASGTVGRVLRRADALAPVIMRVLERDDETRAMLSTTAIVTQLSGAMAANAIPEEATAIVNVRVASGSSVREMTEQLRRAVRDRKVEIDVLEANEPSRVSAAEGRAWDAISRSLAVAHPGVMPVPYDMSGATDGRFAHRAWPDVYRFVPFRMSKDERAALHARDERITVSAFEAGCVFYLDLLSRR